MNKIRSAASAHPYRVVMALGLIVVLGAAFLSRDLIRLSLMGDEPVDLTLPLVAPLDPNDGEVIYRIDPNQSKVTVEVDESLAGVDHRVQMTTQALAGDLGVTNQDASTARVGEIQVDVHQLESDNRLRDRAVEHDFLETHNHRTVRLHSAEIVDVEQSDNGESTFGIEGTLDVKTVSNPVRFDAEAKIQGNALTATAVATIQMSEFEVGPITKIGLVQTSNDVVIKLDIVAVDGRDYAPPVGLSKTVVSTVSGTGPSFESDVQPILEANCASCHQADAVGAQHWKLETAKDASDISEGLDVVTQSGYMPPWPPSSEGVPLEHPRELSEADQQIITEWAKAGGALDVAPDSEIVADQPSEDPPRADLVLDIGDPYLGDGTKKDDYRCFIMDPQLTEPTAMTGYVFNADETRVTHHALTYQLPQIAREGADAQDAADEETGWSCSDSMGGGSRGGRLVGGWVPGQRPKNNQGKTGFILQPGDFLVTQMHYHYEGTLLPDKSGASLELTTDIDSVIPLRTRSLIGPVELPCPPGADGEFCDRAAALDDSRARFGGGAGVLADGTHIACGTDPETLGAMSDGNTAQTVCQFPVRDHAIIVDFLGHMHEIGSEYRMTLNPDTPEEQTLLHIPNWDFAWQLNYQPEEPLKIGPGDVIEVECNWDRSLRFDPNPRYIFFAEGTEDEMCFSTVTVIQDPDHPEPVQRGRTDVDVGS